MVEVSGLLILIYLNSTDFQTLNYFLNGPLNVKYV